MTKKIKLSEAAKNLNVSSQELIDYFAQQGDTKKKSGSSITESEMNLLLEHYSKMHEVESLDDYFASRNQPKPVVTEKTEPEKKTAKKTVKKEKPQPEKKEENMAKPQKNEAADAKADKGEKTESVKKAESSKKEKAAEKTVPPVKSEKAEKIEKTEKAEQVKKEPVKEENAVQKPDNNNNNKKNNKKQPKAQNHGERTKLNVSFSSETASTATKRRTVDTRGTYVDLDKYNERYEQIAPANKHKDNYSSKKQKINQKSAQRNRQQYSRKETEAEKLRRLELERARSSSLKYLSLITYS